MRFQDVPIEKLEVLRAAKPSNHHFRIRSEASQDIKILVFVVMSVVEGSTRDREHYLSLVTEQEMTKLIKDQMAEGSGNDEDEAEGYGDD